MKTRPNTLMMHHYTRKCTTQHLDHLDHYKHIHVLICAKYNIELV